LKEAQGNTACADAEELRILNVYTDRVLGGDIIVEQNIHVIDVANWPLQSRPTRACGTGGRVDWTGSEYDVGDAWDHFAVTYWYPNDVSATRKHFDWWHNWAVRSRLKSMIEKARMLRRRFDNIVTYLRHPITNAASESLNSKIQCVKYTARGFRSQSNFITAIYFHCGGLDLMPSPTK